MRKRQTKKGPPRVEKSASKRGEQSEFHPFDDTILVILYTKYIITAGAFLLHTRRTALNGLFGLWVDQYKLSLFPGNPIAGSTLYSLQSKFQSKKDPSYRGAYRVPLFN